MDPYFCTYILNSVYNLVPRTKFETYVIDIIIRRKNFFLHLGKISSLLSDILLFDKVFSSCPK